VKRSRRRALNGLAFVSLLLFLVAIVLSIRSRAAADEIGWGWSNERYYLSVDCWRGEIGIHRFFDVDNPPHTSGSYFHVEKWGAGNTLQAMQVLGQTMNGSPDSGCAIQFSGFGFYRFKLDSGGYLINMFIPLWAVMLGSAPLPAYWLIRRIRIHARPGHCPKCGYDLRATPDRCPECGKIPETAI
jgi:hypothetical protein